MLAWLPVRGNQPRGTALGPGKACLQVLGPPLPESLCPKWDGRSHWAAAAAPGSRPSCLPLQPPAPTLSSPLPALPARRLRVHPAAPWSLRPSAPCPTARQRWGHHRAPSCLSTATCPVCLRRSRGQTAHVHRRTGLPLSSCEDAVGAGEQQPHVLTATPTHPPGGGHQGPPGRLRQPHAEDGAGSEEEAAHEAAPRCNVGTRAPRAGQEDAMAAGEGQPQGSRAPPADQQDLQHRDPRWLPECPDAGDRPGKEGGPSAKVLLQGDVGQTIPAAHPKEAAGAGPNSGGHPGNEAAPRNNIRDKVPTDSPRVCLGAAVRQP